MIYTKMLILSEYARLMEKKTTEYYPNQWRYPNFPKSLNILTFNLNSAAINVSYTSVRSSLLASPSIGPGGILIVLLVLILILNLSPFFKHFISRTLSYL